MQGNGKIDLLIGVFCVVLSAMQVAAMSRAEERLPNVVIIFTDDQGYQDVGCFGSPDIRTPHLDQLAEEGMQFTDFYSASSVCTPSRAGLLTGRYPVRMGLANGVLFPHTGARGLPAAEQTLPELMKERGYRTACVGKWHLGHVDSFLPTGQGFDLFYGIPYSNDMWIAPEIPAAPDVVLNAGVSAEQLEVMRDLSRFAFDETNKPNKNLIPLMRNEEMIEFPVDQTTLTGRLTDEAIRFVESCGAEPFLLYLAHPMPHIPLFASEAFMGRSEAGLYGDVIEELDASTGRLLAALEAAGVAEDTWVIFTSDNGPWLTTGKASGHALPLRSGKGTVFEGGMRVPCIMRWPGRIPAGSVCGEIASTLDLLPSIARELGVTPKNEVDGSPLQSLLLGEQREDSFAYLYYNVRGKPAALRVDNWKLIFDIPAGETAERHEKQRYAGGLSEPELYNLSNDIGEKQNLYSQAPERAAAMRERADEWIRSISSGSSNL
jgi:arylsulfatase A-like enzyme